jgi:hypothetical protein
VVIAHRCRRRRAQGHDRDQSVAALQARGAVAAAIPTATLTAAAAVDPTFALIAENLAADVAHCEAIDVHGEFDEQRDYSSDAAIEAQENSRAACHYVNEVDWKLANTPPTTLAGVAAVLRFANEIEDVGLEWPHHDTIGPGTTSYGQPWRRRSRLRR